MSGPSPILTPTTIHLESFVLCMAYLPRVVVCGGPRAGKTAVAVRASERYSRPVFFGDALIGNLSWSDASMEVSRWFDREGEWIIEGVVCARALRKWLARNDGRKRTFDVVRVTDGIHDRSDAQSAKAKGEATVWDEIAPALSGCMIEVPVGGVERDKP